MGQGHGKEEVPTCFWMLILGLPVVDSLGFRVKGLGFRD